MASTIALLTDFGTQDTYVGVMKAVMLGINPAAQFIDLTHEIRPQNVRQAALVLLNTYRYCPPGTVFLTVVDPGVGGGRKPIAVRAGDYSFVAPDNGLLSYVLDELPEKHIVELTNSAYRLPTVSHTFHGRDVFAPAAAHLAAGVPLESLGTIQANYAKQMLPMTNVTEKAIIGQVLYSDHFGNLITSIGTFEWMEDEQLQLTPRFKKNLAPVIIQADQVTITAGSVILKGIHRTYSTGKLGEPLALVDSNGFLEIAINQGHAANRLNLPMTTQVIIQIG
ncbi:MAG TPA: SAM-dependent chlorinase/fluorinase [Aggregatilineales bacterium]|nr:SAM-dependent chlorinase/fluorinase [Aggregatilineales bacterium]